MHVLIRLREGDFRYSVSEVDAMLTDVRHAVISGAAVDVCADPVAAVETLVALRVRRVLSSGRAARAGDGAPVLRRMVAAVGGVLSVMACGGIRPHNARAIAAATGVRDLHAAPRCHLPASPPS
ncbi:copper homeostasis protein CutC [Amycolatopsis pithecellobii]|uniref:copper homeostasis protein CutC n=1 Tax=Amycolatopsis pithecellobii TaxID=664692 RepID=UPI0028A7B14A|nr:copper homeostasis protein CutC [Amycolatopsis pithecellobii]